MHTKPKPQEEEVYLPHCDDEDDGWWAGDFMAGTTETEIPPEA